MEGGVDKKTKKRKDRSCTWPTPPSIRLVRIWKTGDLGSDSEQCGVTAPGASAAPPNKGKTFELIKCNEQFKKKINFQQLPPIETEGNIVTV